MNLNFILIILIDPQPILAKLHCSKGSLAFTGVVGCLIGSTKSKP